MTFHIGPTGAWKGGDAHLHHAWSPQLGAWIGDYFRGQEDVPLYDFGCGLGHYLAVLEDRGFRRHQGFEREKPLESLISWERIEERDLTRPIIGYVPGNVLCLEVAEHIPAFYEDPFLDNLTRHVSPCHTLVLSWAVRGQGGAGHVNCRDNYEVIHRLAPRGFVVELAGTRAAREVITPEECPWFKGSLLVFRKLP